jgi:hypothetical protein
MAAMRSFQKIPAGARVVITGALLVTVLSAAPLVTAFQQLPVPDAPSPEGGSAQVVAQGVVAVPQSDLRWQVARRTAPLPANAVSSAGQLGFIVVEGGVLLVENAANGDQHRLGSGEAMLAHPGSDHVRAALGSDTASYLELALIDATAESAPEGAELAFTSEPFAGLGAGHDFELLQDALGPSELMSVPVGALPTLLYVADGAVQVQTEAGDILPLNAGEAVALSGPLTLTAGETGASVNAAFTGPAVPRLRQAQAAATPAATGRVIEPAAAETATAPAAATPASTAEVTEAPVDEDGDGLDAAQEAELNTDPALADTDEDGLIDGQEVNDIGTAPLAPDSDGDGVLDGDEVAQGTDPLDGLATTAEVPAEEGVPAVEEQPVEGPVAPAGETAAVGDSDGDGLKDEIELSLGTDLADGDTDDDGALDGDEYYVHQTGTRNPDTDADGILDGDEVANGTNPNDPASF